ncbi:hypothetical protein B0O99DRAFT_600163 [Bisporella sp. PMI_857]|nr:hypothetical protein B0O99DRAFT_600163 [Bisporella sp. PMI_857]
MWRGLCRYNLDERTRRAAGSWSVKKYGRRALEELLGARDRNWGAAEDEEQQLMELGEDVDERVFDQDYYADSDDKDEVRFSRQHLRDIVQVQLWLMFRKEYWSRLWIIQELAVSPMTSTVHRGESVFHLSTLQAIGDILATYSESRPSSNSEIWEELRPRLDLLAWITLWRIRERDDIEQGGKRLCGPGMHIQSVEDEVRHRRRRI